MWVITKTLRASSAIKTVGNRLGFLARTASTGQVHLEYVTIEKEQGAEGLFWVDAATFRSTARWVRKASISGVPIWRG